MEARARSLLGPDVALVRRAVVTLAGGRTGLLVVGYQVCRRSLEAPGGAVVLGISPPDGAELDLSALGTPEEALKDALHRHAAGLPPYREAVPGRLPDLVGTVADEDDLLSRPPPPRPNWDLTTSTLSLPMP